MRTADYTVIGGGIIGLTIALELKRCHSDSSVLILEKEPEFGRHASGRNSGVLHAGFYYTSDSLKARFTARGNALLKEYCRASGIPLNECGKLVVAREESDVALLDVLLERGSANKVRLMRVTEAEAKAIEPRSKTCGRAVFSPDTATVDPSAVISSLLRDARRLGIETAVSTKYLARDGRDILTTAGRISTGYLVNAAGLYADKVASDFGFAEGLRILPFKGIYLYSDEPPGSLRTNIYPVPDLRNPFLGTHLTVTVDGHVKVGPTAAPALWREQYGWTARFSPSEFAAILATMGSLFLRSDWGFRSLARREIKKYWRPHLVAQASALAEGIEPANFRRWGIPGIRAQLLDLRNRRLVMDFCGQGDERSYHILNAVSPAFTCSLAFAQYVAAEIRVLLGERGVTP